ncbi:uncharacterized protein FOMMEDRAFT_149742 [Fomitiporia mediterranea MF3/22]|uniref:uncharacterized protein n=1 Tax=Fomitiporia mediterranea (strain MF3/22) TaxID=694068 RepID=UPI0004407952|nr:uncharacterized protein FOMMEDRAFT_149742 [Fomitiporia mediterranea MF3/22]EJD07231.1 hypothetical protein FOMMEDRAFT_149742 [Fomitiporia mediterranea MF3/22]
MDHKTSTTEHIRLRPNSGAASQVFLLIAIVKELVSFLLALVRGITSLESLYTQLRASRLERRRCLGGIPSRGPASETDSEDTTSTFGVYDCSLDSAVQQLCRAIVRRDCEAVSCMLKAVPCLVSKRHRGGWFPLHAAVLSGDIDLIRLILSCPNTDVNAVYEVGTTSVLFPDLERELGLHVDGTTGARPLHYACMIGNADIINLLTHHGALLNARDEWQREPIDYFDMQRDLDIATAFSYLYNNWRDRHEFYNEYANIDDVADLIRQDKYDLFKQALHRRPQLASKFTYYDYSLLHLAVVRGRRYFAEHLLSICPSLINEYDNRSIWSCEASLSSFAPPGVPHKHVKDATALHYACLIEDLDIITLLIKAGADWNIKDYRGRKPEDLFYPKSENYDHIKNVFSCLCVAEEEKRKMAVEESVCHGDVNAWKEAERIGMNAWSDWGECHANTKEPLLEVKREECVDVPPPKPPAQSFLSLEKVLEETLVGQRGPIRTVANAVRLREGKWVDPDRPLTMLFLGSSGVGKTELAKQLALFIHGQNGLSTNNGDRVKQLEKEHAFVRIDMSEYQERHSAYNLIGAPKSYVGYGDGGALTQPLKKNPKAIVLLDEIEKAHPDVLNMFLQVFDDGRITDSKDGVVCCKDAIFIMTSNIASDEIKESSSELRELVALTETEDRPESYLHVIREFTRSIRPILKQSLKRDEFIGRINEIAVFLPLSEEEIEIVVERELGVWARRAEEEHGIKLSWSNEVVKKLASAYEINYGVRSVANEVQRVAIHLVADAQISGKINDKCNAVLLTDEFGDIKLDTTSED